MGKVTLYCQKCGDEYERYESQADGSKYCSMECKAKDTIGQKKRVDKECDECGKEFEVQKHRESSARFCSVQCRADWQQRNYRGEDHDNYEDGSTMLYGGTIAKTRWLRLAERARERDEHECTSCGMSNEVCWEKYNQSLSVHHKVKPQEYDGDDAHDMSNLETLCASCHQSQHVTEGEKGTQ